MRYLWMTIGWLCMGLGIAGAFLPLLPTTPFLLLAAFAFSRGSHRWHNWLLEHPQFGPLIHHWHTHGAISTRAKIVASVSMGVIFAFSVFMQVPQWLLLTQGVVLSGVALFLWTRRAPPDES